MGCFSADAPAPVNYGQQTRDTLQAQVDLAPQQYANEAQYQPLYANLALSNINTLLNGAPGGTTSYTTSGTANQTGWYDSQGNYLSPGDRNAFSIPGIGNYPGRNIDLPGYHMGSAPADGAVWHNSGDKFDIAHTRTTNSTPGLFQLMQQQQTNQRQNDIADVANLGPQARAAMLAANPDQAALLEQLNAQALAGLKAGTKLTPGQVSEIRQNLGDWADRGLAFSNPAILDQVSRMAGGGQDLLQRRQQFAQSMLGSNQSVVGDPFQQILGRSSGAIPQAQSILGQSGPSLFNPESALAGAITSGNQAMDQFFSTNGVAGSHVGQGLSTY